MNLDKDCGENQTPTVPHRRLVNRQSPPRAVILHGRCGPEIMRFCPVTVSELVDPTDGDFPPWRGVLHRGCLHLTHVDFTNWLGPVSSKRSRML